jgi:hypothetical protein
MPRPADDASSVTDVDPAAVSQPRRLQALLEQFGYGFIREQLHAQSV